MKSTICTLILVFHQLIGLCQYNLSGTVTYHNSANSPMDGTTLQLYKENVLVGTSETNTSGNYVFLNLSNGNYSISASTQKTWGGVNSTDILKINLHFAGIVLITDSLKIEAMDVNNSGSINLTDIMKLKRVVVGLDPSLPRQWIFRLESTNSMTFSVNNNSLICNIKAQCAGDVNGSYNP